MVRPSLQRYLFVGTSYEAAPILVHGLSTRPFACTGVDASSSIQNGLSYVVAALSEVRARRPQVGS